MTPEPMQTHHHIRYIKMFVTVLQGVCAIIVGVCGLLVSCQANEIMDAQLKLALAESAPQLNVKVQQSSYEEPGFYDTREILISNEDGYLCNSDAKVKAFAHIQASNGFNALLPVEGVWFAHALTGNTKGLVETIWSPRNWSKTQAAFDEVSERFSDVTVYIELKTYLAFSYQDLQGNDQVRHYRINNVGAATAISFEEYDEATRGDDRMLTNEVWDIDIDSSEEIAEMLKVRMDN